MFYTLFDDFGVISPNADGAVSVGCEFQVTATTPLVGLRYAHPEGANADQRVMGVYDLTDGSLIAGPLTMPVPTDGWVEADLTVPVELAPGFYRVACFHPSGDYPATSGYFDQIGDIVNGPITTLSSSSTTGGVQGSYGYGSSLTNPTVQGSGTNYWSGVIVGEPSVEPPSGHYTWLLTADGRVPVTSRVLMQPPVAEPLPGNAGPENPAPGVALDGAPGVSLQSIDGGPAYFDKWPASDFPAHKTMYPIGQWAAEGLDSQASLDGHKGRVNMFVEDAYTDQDWQIKLDSTGFYSVGQHTLNGGAMVTDEVDMWAGAGYGEWSGKLGFGQVGMCLIDGVPTEENMCGYTALEALVSVSDPDYFHFLNVGKIASCKGPKSEYKTYADMVDVVATDVYFLQEGAGEGDPLTTGWWGVTQVITGNPSEGDLPPNDPRCRRPSNYGRLIRRQRAYVEWEKPVWSFHELVNPTGGAVDPADFRAGLWSAIIAGARGVVYFTHNYIGAGMANSFNDPLFAAVNTEALNFYATVQEYAEILNSPDVRGLIDGPNTIDVLVKWNNGNPLIMTAENQFGTGEATFTTVGITDRTITVIGEDRTLDLVDGIFTDTFATQNAAHVYQL